MVKSDIPLAPKWVFVPSENVATNFLSGLELGLIDINFNFLGDDFLVERLFGEDFFLDFILLSGKIFKRT